MLFFSGVFGPLGQVQGYLFFKRYTYYFLLKIVRYEYSALNTKGPFAYSKGLRVKGMGDWLQHIISGTD